MEDLFIADVANMPEWCIDGLALSVSNRTFIQAQPTAILENFHRLLRAENATVWKSA